MRGGIRLVLPGLVAATALTPTEISVLWGLHHPYWLVAIAISLLILCQIGLSMAGKLVRRSLRWLSQSPFSLGRWLLTKTAVRETAQEQQIATILQRLDSLQREQTTLLAELKEQLPKRE